MKFLWNSEITSAVKELLRTCESARWAVAWAKKSALEFVPLEENWGKIEQLTVGTDFNLTDPEFISEFNGRPNVGFVTNLGGVFHPKVYYFEHGDGNWDCVVGSANFTKSAFSSNSEAAVLINQDDADAEETRKKIIEALDRCRDFGDTLTQEQIEKYRKGFNPEETSSSVLTGTDPSLILSGGWEQFYLDVKHGAERRHDYCTNLDEMLDVLESAQRLFSEHDRFSDIDKGGRRRIAGTIRESGQDEPDWRNFGGMFGSGKFTKRINDNDSRISDAFDHIPLKGPIVRKDFNAFINKFRTKPRGNPMGTATRLLAMKRPDYFVCLNKENKESFCEAYGIPNNVNLDNYWPEVIERIQKTIWWNSPKPPRGKERRVWRCRAAMLDAIYWSRDTSG